MTALPITSLDINTLLQFIFIFYFVKYTPITMDTYEYPPWGEALGFMISLSSMIWVPGYFVYYLLSTPGTWREVLRKGVTPVIVPRCEARSEQAEDVEKQLLQTPEKIRQDLSSLPTNTILEEEELLEQEEKRPLKEESESLSTTEGILSNKC